jgi:8-hydroxy-5-deazaflavin:NADPH oxidoreductase
MKVTIIGAGNMGRGIGTRVVAGGNELQVIDRNPEDAHALARELGDSVTAGGPDDELSGDVVVLALYYPATLEAAAQYGERLAGKVVVEISNPVDTETWNSLATQPGTSAAEELAGRVPSGTPVVKAFNTTFSPTLVAGEVSGQKLDVFVAGDDDGAKGKLTELIEAGGLRAVDCGPLERAQHLEAMGFIHIKVQEPLGTGFASALKELS